MTVAVVPGVHRIEPVPVAQVLDGYDGRMIVVDDDVAGVAADLRAIDPTLELRYSERGGHFAVVQVFDEPDGRHVEHLVTTAPECDQRVVERVRQVTHPSYDLVGELAAVEAAGRKDRAENGPLARALDENADRLAHALRRDLGIQSRIYVP